MIFLKCLTGFTLTLIGIAMLIGCSNLGSSPDQSDLTRFETSIQFNKESGRFNNRRPQDILQAEDDEMRSWALLKKWFDTDGDTAPKTNLAQVKPDLSEFIKVGDGLKSIWVGHSTFLLNMNGTIILVDPVFSDYAAPVNVLFKRFQAPILKLVELPEIDYIVISHDHYDHLDMNSIKHFKSSRVNFITPLGVGAHLEGWGIKQENIIEKDWWEVEEFGDIKFIATPAQHFSGRGINDKNKTLWASWIIQSKDHNVFFSGDSGYDTHFKDIGDTYGPFDVAFMETGQYNKMWKSMHMMPEEAVQAFTDLNARHYFPVHWGMFQLAVHAWYEPVQKLYIFSKAKSFDLIVPKLGQIVNFMNPLPIETWWQTS